MADPDDEKTVINVKGMSLRAWNRAKVAAQRDGATMGEWLTRAVDQLADKEGTGPRELGPDGLAGNPIQPDQAALLLHAIAAVGASPGVPLTKANIGRANRLVEDTMQAIRGLPPRKRRLENQAIQLAAPTAVVPDSEIAHPEKKIRISGNPR